MKNKLTFSESTFNRIKKYLQDYLVTAIFLIFITIILLIFTYDTHNNTTTNLLTLNILEEQQLWSDYIDEHGAQAAYGAYIKKYTPYDFGLQHTLAHVMGELLYEKEGIKGLTICDATFAFGCYHSFFGQAISEEGIEVIPELDRACIEKYGPLGTGCQHGIGHGILGYMGSGELVAALNLCSMTTKQSDIFGCVQGVFMEYYTPIIITTLKTYSDVKDLHKENPHEPCNTIVPKQFRKSCYYEISMWWRLVFDRDYEKLGRLCSEIQNKDYQDVCYLGLGNVVVVLSDHDLLGTLQMCNRMPDTKKEALCRMGAAWRFQSAGVEGYQSSARTLCKDIDAHPAHKCLISSD